MEITCPACGKKSAGGMGCARCGCELAILEKIIRAARHEFDIGRDCLMRGDAAEALRRAEKSWMLKKSPEAARLAFLAGLAMGDFDHVGKWYAKAGRASPPPE